MISVHGLVRGEQLELGRDADTGGQTKYVVELARALAAQPGIRRVDLVTRLVEDPHVDGSYSVPIEPLAERAQIVRIETGPPRYIVKEQLWDHLDTFADNLHAFLTHHDCHPDVLHGHYADAGYVGARLAHTLGVPLLFTGHSLGRVKRGRLIASGLTATEIEERYNLSRRIAAEELALASAERVITSTRQEIEEQYGRYDYYQPEQMHVLPPGIDLARFHPPTGKERGSDIAQEIARFLRAPDKPIILALSRPDARKNIAALVEAFGNDETLRAAANLVIVAGNRRDIRDLDTGGREVWTELLELIDRFDLYGHVAYPKRHASDEVPQIYRLAALSGGVFVNPALTEPFGLTLIEAAASGLPIVATEDGGPADIIGHCDNGVLVDPLDSQSIAAGLGEVLGDRKRWRQRAAAGLAGVRKHYSWSAHAQHYVEMLRPIAGSAPSTPARARAAKTDVSYVRRAIFSDLDQSLLADPQSLPELLRVLRANHKLAAFGIATGRRLDSALRVMKKHGIPEPDVLITSGGTEIRYAPDLNEDDAWTRHIEKNWTPNVVRRVLENVPGLLPQPRLEQSRFKISYYIDPLKAPPIELIRQALLREDQTVNVILSFGQFLDILPIRASKGLALRHVAGTLEIALERILVAGGSGADEDMMRGNTLAVVVGNRHREELSQLSTLERTYFTSHAGAAGIVAAIEHYDFWGRCQAPETKE
jgi:sucrose-phosphate synthase